MRNFDQPHFSQIQAGIVRVNAELNVLDADQLPEPAQ